MNILVIAVHCHDSAGCLVRDGEIVAAAQEERFWRKQHDALPPPAGMLSSASSLLAQEHVNRLVPGRMESGAGAHGSRSILVDPRSPRTQAVMNLKIKCRESFRPVPPFIYTLF